MIERDPRSGVLGVTYAFSFQYSLDAKDYEVFSARINAVQDLGGGDGELVDQRCGW